MPGGATFEPDKADITPAFKKSLTTAARGLGPLNPMADNDSADGRQLNRRVEITVRPLLHLP